MSNRKRWDDLAEHCVELGIEADDVVLVLLRAFRERNKVIKEKFDTLQAGKDAASLINETIKIDKAIKVVSSLVTKWERESDAK